MIKVIDVYSDSCNPCKQQKPIIEEMAETTPDVTFEMLNVVDATGDFLEEHNIMGVPTILIFKDDEKVYQGKGFHPRELLEGLLGDIV